MVPATTRVIKLAAPTSSPIASSGLSEEIAAHVEKMSGPKHVVSIRQFYSSRGELRTAIPKGEERHSGERIAHPEGTCDRAEVDRKEVAGSDAHRHEQESSPRNENEPRPDFGRPKGAVVQLEVRDPSVVFVLTVLLHKRALI